MPNLSRFVQSAVAAVVGLLLSGYAALAQVYYQPAPRFYPAPQYLPQPFPGPGGYPANRGYRDPRYYEDEEDYRPRRRNSSRRDLGQVCVTSRGNCDLGALVPIGSGCRCQIPGFGRKAGQVGY